MIRAIVQKKVLLFVQFCCACGVVVCTASSSMLDVQECLGTPEDWSRPQSGVQSVAVLTLCVCVCVVVFALFSWRQGGPPHHGC